MIAELIAVTLSALPAAQQRPQHAPRAPRFDVGRAQEDAESLNQLLTRLLHLQQRVRSGALPADDDLALARTPREAILAGIDVHRALWLGVEPKSVRDRLAPGFSTEIELLVAQRAQHRTGPLLEPSPLLLMVLDLEQDLWREADRRRRRIGISSPLDSGPLSQRLQPNAAAPDPSVVARGTNAGGAATGETPVAGTPPAPSLPKGGDLRLLGQAHYRAGRYAEALLAWKELPVPTGSAGLEFEYQRADCRLRTGAIDEAITTWEKLAADNKSSSWGAQAEFALKVAKALQAVHAAQKAQAAAEPAAPIDEANDSGESGESGESAEMAESAKPAKEGAP